MAKKAHDEEVQEEFEMEDEDISAADASMDFNLDEEYKPQPLMAKGNYFGNVIEVKRDTKQSCVIFVVALEGNEGVMSDGTTPIDGQKLRCNVWLPKAEDRKLMTKSGRETKWQWKINAAKKFAEKMEINMNSLGIIDKAIMDAAWVGIPVVAEIGISSYKGEERNDINSMARQRAED